MVHEVPLPLGGEPPEHEYNEEGSCWCKPILEEREGFGRSVLWVIHQWGS